MSDPFLDALTAVRQQPQADPFLAALDEVRQPATPAADTRSTFARAVDALSEPSAPGQWVQRTAQDVSNWITTPRLDDSRALAMLKGGIGGMTEGVGNVLAGFSSPLGIAATLSGFGAEKAAAGGLLNAARALRAVEAGTGAAFGARGLEQAADAPDVAGKALGVSQAAAGALGVRGGVNGLRGIGKPPATAPRPVVGQLRPGPSFVANEVGTVAKAGETVPMVQAPDGSFVRSVPAEYARREVRGELPPGPSFIAPESGPAATLEQAAADPFTRALAEVRGEPTAAKAPDASGVRSVPAAIADRAYDEGKVSRTIYSGDPNAVDAPKVQLSEAEARELRRIAAELDNLPFVKHSFNYDIAGRGGSPEVVGGAAGAPVYQDIIRPLGYRPTRSQVLNSIRDFLDGRFNRVGQEALDVARLRLAGDRSVSIPSLPPEAGDAISVPDFAQALAEEGEKPIAEVPFALTREAARPKAAQPSLLGSGLPVTEDMPASFAAAVDDAATAHPGTASSVREPGEEGHIRSELAARLGLGTAGAAYGAATGETPEDRLKRAALFGAAGAFAPSLLKGGASAPLVASQAGRTAKTPTMRPTIVESVPPSRPIPTARMLEFPSLQKMPEAIRGEIANLLEQHSGFTEQRRNVQPMARTEALADRIEVPLKTLNRETALNAEELAAYKNAVASVMTERQPLVEKIRNGTATDAEKVKFSELTDRGTVLIASYRGAKAEAGRALNILRNKARVLEYGDEGFIRKAMEAPGFSADLERISKAAVEAGGDPLKQLDALRAAAVPTRWQNAQAVYYNSLLSGVKTHLRNSIGNSFNMLANLVNPIGAAPADAIRSRVTGAPRTTYLAEMPTSVAATVTAMPGAFRDALFTVRHGFTPRAVAEAAAGKFDVVRGEIPGGMVPNLPSRALEAADTFFRSLAYKQELAAAAYAKARSEGATQSGPLAARMADLMTGSSPEALDLQQRAEVFAARAVFQEQPGPVLSRIVALKNDPDVPVPFRLAMTFVAPFIKTPGNILRQGAEYTPAGFAMKATKAGGREGAQALGRAALGSIALAPIAYLAATGRLSGNGPTDPGERAALMEKGWRPNSLKIGNTWTAYNLFQPISVAVAAVANAWERFAKSDRSDRAAEESFTAAVSGAASSFLDQSFLAGVSGLLDSIQDPERNAKRFMSQFAQGLVPASGLLRNVTQAVDPVVRQPEGAVEAVKTIVPGLSTDVPPRLDRFGQPVVRPGGPIRRGFTVPEVSEEHSTPVMALLERVGVTPQVPRGTLKRRGETVPLTREQDFARREAIGRERQWRLERLANLPNVAQIPDLGLKRLVEQEVARATQIVDARMLGRLSAKLPLTTDSLVTPHGTQP